MGLCCNELYIVLCLIVSSFVSSVAEIQSILVHHGTDPFLTRGKSEQKIITKRFYDTLSRLCPDTLPGAGGEGGIYKCCGGCGTGDCGWRGYPLILQGSAGLLQHPTLRPRAEAAHLLKAGSGGPEDLQILQSVCLNVGI